MTKYTVRVQQSEGSIVTPVHVESTDVTGAIRAAADHLALHGAVHRVDVYRGHDGWYDNSERLWTGSLNWSQESNAACEMLVSE